MSKQTTIVFLCTFVLIVNGKITSELLNSIHSALTTINRLENQCVTSSDCLIEPIGARACGGPEDYIVYSGKSSYAKYIASLAELTTRLDGQYNEGNLIESTCDDAEKPTAVCDENKTCRAQ